VVAKVKAFNERGWGAFSADNTVGALIQTKPAAMGAPTRGSNTGIDRIHLEWTPLTSPSDGYSSITSYSLEWDAGGGALHSWDKLVGFSSNYVQTSYLVTSGIVQG
jgi:hypothetical protein